MIGYVGVTIVDVQLTGSSKYVSVQFVGVMADNATLVSAKERATSSSIYMGVSLSR